MKEEEEEEGGKKEDGERKGKGEKEVGGKEEVVGRDSKSTVVASEDRLTSRPGRALSVSRIQAEAAVPSSAPFLLLSLSLLLSFPFLLSYRSSSFFSSSPFVTRCQHSYSLWRSLVKGHKATRGQRVHFSRSWRHGGLITIK